MARAVVAGESRQVWGTVDAQARYTRYLHDNDTYSVSFTFGSIYNTIVNPRMDDLDNR